MKLTSKMAAILASTMLFSACSANTNSSNILASVNPDTEILAADVYNELLNSSSGKSSVYQYIIKKVIDGNFPITDAMKTEADLAIESIQNSYTSYYGAQAETYLLQALQSSGFSSLDDYRETLIYSFQLKEFLNKYIEENFDTVFEDYYTTKNPRYVSHILVKMSDSENPTEEEQKKVDEIQALIDQGKDFAEIAKEYSDDSSASSGGELGICDADTSFVTEFKTVALQLKEGEVSAPTKSDYGYHFIKVTSTNKDQMKIDEQVLEERLPSYDSYMLYAALQSYELTFADQTIQEIYDTQLAASLSARETARNGGTN